MKSVAIAVPLHRLPLTEDENISLRVLRNTLGNHPRYFVTPRDLEVPADFLRGEKIITFPADNFTYPLGYNRLLMSRSFYRRFSPFDHLLIYQLDCLVFRDELEDWCSRNYDYIGAPWLDDFGEKPAGRAIWKVGNGGFSLRKVSTAQAVLSKRVKRGIFFPHPPIHFPKPDFLCWLTTNLRNRFKQHLNLWTVEDELKNYGENEDRFWALDVLRILPEYRKPAVDEALGFAFEMEPDLCLEMNGGALPFGCHAWGKHDRRFWERVLREIP